MTITNTTFIVNDSDYSVPGDLTIAQVVAAYSSTIPGLATMQATESINGSTRTIQFRPRTGTKGATVLINTTALARLADSGLDDELASLGVDSVTSELQAAMAELSAKRRKADVESAATVILDLNSQVNSQLTNNLTAINGLKDQIAAIEKANEAIVRARKYGQVTDNWLPLAATVGAAAPHGTKDALKVVPKDWTAPVAATAPAASATA